MKLGKWLKFQNLCIYSLSTPKVVETELIFALQAAVSESLADFKIAVLDMKLGHWPKFQKFQILPLSTQRGRN